MTNWRERIGQTRAEELLKGTISIGLKTKAVKPSQLKRVNVDTTVQEKKVRFPTDARLYDRARQHLVEAAAELRILLRQNYNRNSKLLLLKQSRYAHALQMRRPGRFTAKLKTYLDRVIRDIERNQFRTKNLHRCYTLPPGFIREQEMRRTKYSASMLQK